ncbi:MAG TPA: hypothetical protein VKE74_01220 [Gemmataceae bacterium]|nr:hypothetical protein [Gemmataceae bacterium]
MERTFTRSHRFHSVVTRDECCVRRYDGFVYLASAFIALNRL